MNFLQQLDEAANIPLDELKEKMKKDPRVKMVFQRSLNVDELKDPIQFQKTIHYYLFNNPHVRAYIEKRGDRRDVSKHWAKSLAGHTKPTQKIEQFALDWLMGFVKELFKDVGYVQKKDISKRGFESLQTFLSAGLNSLDAYSAREIASLDIKTGKPLTLYRGLLFNESSLRSYDGLSGGEGLQFLKSVREGTRVVDLKLVNHTIWTKSKEEAKLNALFGDSESSWRDPKDVEGGKVAKHRGKLAFVISTLATADDVLVELSEFGKVYSWPKENQPGYNRVVLNPGTHTCRIISRHTPDGEEEVIKQEDPDDDSLSLDTIGRTLGTLGRLLKLPYTEDIKFEDLMRFASDPTVMVQVGELVDPEKKERISKLLNIVVSFYQKHLKDIDMNKLADQAAKNGPAWAALLKIKDEFDKGITHKRFADPNSSRAVERQRGYAKIRDLESGDIMMSAHAYDSDLVNMTNAIITQKRVTDWRAINAAAGLAKIGKPGLSIPNKLHLSGWAQQKEIFDAAVDGFYKIIGKPKPDSNAEIAKDMQSALLDAKRVAFAAKFLQGVRDAALMVDQ